MPLHAEITKVCNGVQSYDCRKALSSSRALGTAVWPLTSMYVACGLSCHCGFSVPNVVRILHLDAAVDKLITKELVFECKPQYVRSLVNTPHLAAPGSPHDK